MLSTEEFKAVGEKAVLFLHITSRLPGDADQDLLMEKGGRGFPYLVTMDAGGAVTSFVEKRSVEGFLEAVDEGLKYSKKKADPSLPVAERVKLILFDVAVKNATKEEARTAIENMKGLEGAAREAELLRWDILQGDVSPEDGARKLKAIEGLTPELRRYVDEVLVDMEVQAAMPRGPAMEGRIAAGAKFAALWAEGREPTENMFQPFFILMLDHAESVKDVDLFGRSLDRIRAHINAKFAGEPKAIEFLENQEKRLATLKESK